MGADSITICEAQVNRTLNDILIQLGAIDISANFDSLSHALHELNMWDFVFNEARVIAALHAFEMRDLQIQRKYEMDSWLQDAAKHGYEDKIIPQENPNGKHDMHTEVQAPDREICEPDSK